MFINLAFTAADLFCAAVAMHQVHPGLTSASLTPLSDTKDQWQLVLNFSDLSLANAVCTYSWRNHPCQTPSLYCLPTHQGAARHLLKLQLTNATAPRLITGWLPELGPDPERAFIQILEHFPLTCLPVAQALHF